MEWKKVEDGLPVIPNKSVLFMYDRGNKIGYGSYGYKIKNTHSFYDRTTDENVVASHWLDIPSLPEYNELD